MARTSLVVSLSFAMCALLYFAIGIIGYMRVGDACFINITSVECLDLFPRFANVTV
jgi:hypothetical protein